MLSFLSFFSIPNIFLVSENMFQTNFPSFHYIFSALIFSFHIFAKQIATNELK